MAAERSPAFQFYPKDFLTDERVRLMSHTERGIYITLLSLCWLEQSLPGDGAALAKLVDVPASRFRKIWAGPLSRCFRVGTDGRLYQKRLDAERQKQDAHREQALLRGEKGASARWTKHAPSTAQAMPSDGSSSSISHLPSPISKEQQRPDARSRRPIYTSERFAVFEWQFDELSKMLGPHFDGFRLDEFFNALTLSSRDKGLVIPKADAWPWLQAQVLAEAKRRGLPIATPAPDVPANPRISGLAAGGQAFLERAAKGQG